MSIQRICSCFFSYVLLSLFLYRILCLRQRLPSSAILNHISTDFQFIRNVWRYDGKLKNTVDNAPFQKDWIRYFEDTYAIAYNRYWIFSRIFISASLALLYRTDFLSTFSAYPFGGAEHYSRSCFIVVVAVNVRHHESSLSQLTSLDLYVRNDKKNERNIHLIVLMLNECSLSFISFKWF